MAKITVQQIEALKPAGKPYKKNVDTGLQLRVATDGVKTWIVQYVVNGKQRDYRLSRRYGSTTDAGHLSLKDARGEAMKIRTLAREGIDYQVKLAQDREAEDSRRALEEAAEAQRLLKEKTENLTVSDLFESWLQDGVSRKDGNAELRRSFEKDVLPEIGMVLIKNLTEHDLRNVMRKMVLRGVNRLAVLTHGNLTQMFQWAEKRQPWRKLFTEGNPVDLIEIEKIISPEYDIRNERSRILSPDEIRKLDGLLKRMRHEYEQAPDKRFATRPLEKTTECAIWIMLSTLCRVGELTMARWEHVDLDVKAEFFIPRQNTKGSTSKQLDLTVYLSPFAVEKFRKLHKITGHTDWCFPASHQDGHVCVKSISKQIGDRQTMFKKAKDGKPRQPMKNRSRAENSLVLSDGNEGDWTPHDLRRTGATLMQELGVPLDIIDRCQNHVLPGSKVRRHYLHHDYADEKREAWHKLGERLSTILKPLDNVIVMEQVA